MEGNLSVSEKKIDSTVLKQKQTENSNLLSLQSMLSQINEDQRAFEEKSLKELDSFKAFANNFINDMKKVGIMQLLIMTREIYNGFHYTNAGFRCLSIFEFNISGCSSRNHSSKSGKEISSKNYRRNTRRN